MIANVKSAELIANDFVAYLYKKYKGTRHVRMVASWIGFIILAVARASDAKMRLRRVRQLEFEYRDHTFRVAYGHKVGPRGGIDIVEILPGRGEPLGEAVVKITTLMQAEEVYNSLEALLRDFVAAHPLRN